MQHWFNMFYESTFQNHKQGKINMFFLEIVVQFLQHMFYFSITSNKTIQKCFHLFKILAMKENNNHKIEKQLFAFRLKVHAGILNLFCSKQKMHQPVKF